jgi:uncharacterized membrane protein YgaE (UPF0421/DUF939 family)
MHTPIIQLQEKIAAMSISLAGASALVAQVIDVQLTGAQVVGWAVGAVGFLIALLISVIGYFLTKKLDEINTNMAEMRKELNAVSTWKAEREAMHKLRNELQAKKGHT